MFGPRRVGKRKHRRAKYPLTWRTLESPPDQVLRLRSGKMMLVELRWHSPYLDRKCWRIFYPPILFVMKENYDILWFFCYVLLQYMLWIIVAIFCMSVRHAPFFFLPWILALQKWYIGHVLSSKFNRVIWPHSTLRSYIHIYNFNVCNFK